MGMDITKIAINQILGIDEGQSGRKGMTIIPLSNSRREILQDYIIDHELNPDYINSQGEAVLLVNKKLVELSTGSGFGELALLSDNKRMASIKTMERSSLATLTRAHFSTCLRKAQKRKMDQQVQFLLTFSLFKNLETLKMKLQRIFYLLEEQTHSKNNFIFK